ncbi:MAG: MFS transporter [Deltaproteobacteria bacterium]|nr:MFS transporter [Deltaproteobacteria bacterium]
MKNKIFYGWWIVIVTNLICMLGFGTWLYSFGVFFKPMMSEFGWTRAMTSLAASLRSIEGGVAGPVVGWAVDRYGARKVIFSGGLVSGLGFCLMPFVNSLVGFYLIYGVLISIGMSAMLYIPAFVVVAKWFSRKLSRALSVLAVGAGLGGLVFAPISAVIIQHYGWRMAFLIIGVVIWVVVLPLTLVIKEDPQSMGLKPDGELEKQKESDPENIMLNGNQAKTERASDLTLKQALGSSAFWIISLSFFFQNISHSAVFVHAVPALTDAGISVEKAALAIGYLTTVSIIGRLGLGYLGDFMDKRYLFLISFALMGSGMLVLMNARDMVMVYIFIALFGIGFGSTVPLMAAMRAEYFGRAALGKIQGFMSPVTMFAGAIGPFSAGYLFDKTGTYRTAFLVMGLVTFLGGLIMLFAKPARFSQASDS